MANTKISALTDGTTAYATDKIPAERSGANVYITPGYIKTAIVTGGTVTTSSPVLDMTQTWNAGGVTFTGLKFNVTDTASAADSLLLDLRVGGSSVAFFRKSGAFALNNVFYAETQLGTSHGAVPVFRVNQSSTGYAITRGDGRSIGWGIEAGWSTVSSDGSFRFHSGTDLYSGSADTFIYRDAANVIAQRNDANTQTFRVYRTWGSSGTNFQRITLGWNTTTALVMNEGGGTGADGSVAFNDAALATDATRGFIMIPSCAGAPTGTPADIPTGQIPIVFDSTNNKLYVYDGGWLSTAALT